jgi:hypothetical protein
VELHRASVILVFGLDGPTVVRSSTRFYKMSIFLLKELVNKYFASSSTLLIFCSEAQVLFCICFCVYCNMCVKSWYLTCLYFLLFCCLLCTSVLTSRTRSIYSRVFLCIGVLLLCNIEYVTVFYLLLFFRLFVHFDVITSLVSL